MLASQPSRMVLVLGLVVTKAVHNPATKYAAFWVIEDRIFMKDLVDCSATTHGVIFTKYVAQITKQQGRYAVGHGLSPLVIRSRGRESASLSRCTHPRKVAARRGV